MATKIYSHFKCSFWKQTAADSWPTHHRKMYSFYGSWSRRFQFVLYPLWAWVGLVTTFCCPLKQEWLQDRARHVDPSSSWENEIVHITLVLCNSRLKKCYMQVQKENATSNLLSKLIITIEKLST